MPDLKEEYSRVLINKKLEIAGWNLLDTKQVELAMSSKSGESDYLLLDQGKPLAVLEAKRPNTDPYIAKKQAKDYSNDYKVKFVILSNGFTHYFWDLESKRDAYEIQNLPSLNDLKRIELKKINPKKRIDNRISKNYFKNEGYDIELRNYQIDAIKRITDGLNNNQNKFLLEMATGTGKTILAAALIKTLLENKYVERVLFLVDRVELAKQTWEDFQNYLKIYSPVIYNSKKFKHGDILGSSVIISTLQSMLAKRKYRKDFTPFYFDLIVNDEAHRSIYGNSREIMEYFNSIRIGLTATPKNYLKNLNENELSDSKKLELRKLKDTYSNFDCDPGESTFRYDLIDAVNDPEGPFLVLPKILNLKTDITNQSLDDKGWSINIDDQDYNFKIGQLEKKVFIPERNKIMCEEFLKNGLKEPNGNFGKSIIFTISKNHAREITKILNSIKPESAIQITSDIPHGSDLAKDFRDNKLNEKIAVTVDMLSTGYNCRDILNLGFFRPVFSPTSYIQMKGRGTRLFEFKYKDKIFPKENFYILDFCGVAEFFDEKYDYNKSLIIQQDKKVGLKKGEFDSENFQNKDTSVDETSFNQSLLPTWKGRDLIVNRDLIEVGNKGQKVDYMTFRGEFEKELNDVKKNNSNFRNALDEEDLERIDTIIKEEIFDKPEMYFNKERLNEAYNLPIDIASLTLNILNGDNLPTKNEIIQNYVDDLSYRNKLSSKDKQILQSIISYIFNDKDSFKKFLERDYSIFNTTQFNQLGGIKSIQNLKDRENIFNEIRDSRLNF